MASISTLNYAVPPEFYFWKWSDDGSAIESPDGKTLAFRQEVLTILQSLADADGIPPLGSLLIVNAACAGQIDHFFESYDAITREVDSDGNTQRFGESLRKALTSIASLPAELRTGTQAKTRLFHSLFSQTTWSHEGERARLIVEEILSEMPSLWTTQNVQPQAPAQRLLRDCTAIIKSTSGITASELEHKIKTGLEFEELASTSFDEDLLSESEDTRSLLDQLSTAGQEQSAIAAIAKQVIGLIAIPQPAKQDDILPIGGVADIINRGSPDKLLTSELAWGDTILATRLAQNEALFYQRETPPQSSASQRLILMDHGLRYWGLLRLYSLATHLGLKCYDAKDDQLIIKTFIGTEKGYSPLTLDTVADVQAALTLLPVHLSFTQAIEALTLDLQDTEKDEPISDIFLISTKESIVQPNTEQALHQLTTVIRQNGGRLFCIELNADGDIAVIEHRARGSRILQQGQLDLDELLPIRESNQKKKKASSTLVATDLEKLTGSKFYQHYPSPLRLPVGPKLVAGCEYSELTQSVIGVDSSSCLVNWDTESLWAEELSQVLPGRDHWVSRSDDNCILVACSGSQAGDSVRVFSVNADWTKQEISISHSSHAFPRDVQFSDSELFVFYSKTAEVLSLDTGEKIISDWPVKTETIGIKHRVSNGEITSIGTNESLKNARNFFKSRDNKFTSTSQTEHPINAIAIGTNKRGSLLLWTTKEVYKLHSETLRWVTIDSTKLIRPVTKIKLSLTGQSVFHPDREISQATQSGLCFSIDPRGYLHLKFKDICWSLTIFEGPIDLWKSTNELEKKPSRKEFKIFLEYATSYIKPSHLK